MKIAADNVVAPPFCFDSPGLRGFNQSGTNRTLERARGQSTQAVKRFTAKHCRLRFGLEIA